MAWRSKIWESTLSSCVDCREESKTMAEAVMAVRVTAIALMLGIVNYLLLLHSSLWYLKIEDYLDIVFGSGCD